MPNTFTLIASSTVTAAGGAASIDFTSIPSTYTDLCVLVSVRSAEVLARSDLRLRFNSSTSGYTGRELRGFDSGSVGSTTSSAGYFDCARIPASQSTASTFGNAIIYVPNYTSSNNKSFSVDAVAENNSSSSYYLSLAAGLWSNSAAITAVNIFTNANLTQYSTAYLYGIVSS
jgi:hypothetical protein